MSYYDKEVVRETQYLRLKTFDRKFLMRKMEEYKNSGYSESYPPFQMAEHAVLDLEEQRPTSLIRLDVHLHIAELRDEELPDSSLELPR